MKNLSPALLLVALTVTIAGWSFPAFAERVWDQELNRYLTPEELGQEDVYLTPDEAAALMFPDSTTIRKELLTLTPEQKRQIEDIIGWKFPESSFECYVGETDGDIDGWALIQNTVGKHKPMTYMVGVNPDGEATNVEVLVYRESRGSEVRTKRFNYQYEGKDVFDPIRINRDIINISGATMSVRSMSAGVKRALVLVNEFYLKPQGLGTETLVAGNKEKGFFESLLGF
ncbi:MAG: FMN-binding protein [Nitrospirales bacterium]|nr:FMN-binding protein [Nitrospira sp.]MDR4500336.1 FMN-binding protein [Nitrospirales bacterium]